VRRFRRLLTSPWPYALWALLVVGGLGATYAADPYLFAFTTLGLAGACAVVTLVGVGAALVSRQTPWPRRAVILACVALSGAAVVAALALLRTFHWA